MMGLGRVRGEGKGTSEGSHPRTEPTQSQGHWAADVSSQHEHSPRLLASQGRSQEADTLGLVFSEYEDSGSLHAACLLPSHSAQLGPWFVRAVLWEAVGHRGVKVLPQLSRAIAFGGFVQHGPGAVGHC